MKSVGELSQVCFQIVLKCLHLARIGRLDILWSVNKLPRSITKWNKCIFRSQTFVPTSWMCKKQIVVSHSSAETEIISLDTGLRLDGLWDLIVSVSGSVSQISDRSGQRDDDVQKHHKS